MRPEVWSGPWPSWPCGSSSTTSESWPHLASPERDELVDDRLRAVDEVAELGLPQHKCVRVADRVAVLEAHRGELRQRRVVHHELATGRRAVGVGGSSCSGVNSAPVLRSMITECRWVKVPRRVSWPDSRTVLPSASSEPSASSSPNAQSTLPS